MSLKGALAAFLLGSFTPSPGSMAPIETALSDAEAEASLRFSYTMTFEWPEAAPVTVRYDAAAREFTTIGGDPEALPRTARQKLENVKRSESKPGGLLYADFRGYLDDITPVDETPDQMIYSFIPSQVGEDEMTAEGDAAVRARLYVDKADAHLARYEVRGLQSFKPNPATRMEEFVVEQDFERLGGDGPAVLVRMYSKQKGERFFRKVDTEFTATFSDFEKVE